MEIAMGIFDLVPVVAFLIGAIILQRDLYNKMSKGAFAVFSTGTIIVFIAGLFKAIHKILYYSINRDFYKLQQCFFPMMATGFILSGIGIMAMLVHKQGKERVYSITLPLFIILADEVAQKTVPQDSGTMIFVVVMVIGVLMQDVCLSIISVRMHKPWIIAILAVAFIFTLGMGYLSSKENMSDWIKEAVNSVAQGSFLAAAIAFRKQGLGKEDALLIKE